jgi:hypothetical protein
MDPQRLVPSGGIIHFLAFCCLFVAGCGGSTLYPVEGNVVVDDKPLVKGTVAYWPDAEKGNTFVGQPTGNVVDGKYTLHTMGSKGAPAGWYKVTVNGSDVVDSSKPGAAKNPVPARFRESTKTPLRIEVVADPGPGAYNLKASGD